MLKCFLRIVLALCFFANINSVVSAKELIVAHDTNFMPFEFKSKDGEYVGFDIDIWKRIAELESLSYKMQPMDFNGIIPGLQTESIDVAIAAISITPERGQVIVFSDEYYLSGLVILVREEEQGISKLEDLQGKVVAVKTGTSSVDFMKAFGKVGELKMFPNIDGSFFELMSGSADAVVFDKPVVEQFASTVGKGRVKIVGPVYNGQPYGIAFSKGQEPLVQKVNNALSEMRKDGSYAAIYKKWFGIDLEDPLNKK